MKTKCYGISKAMKSGDRETEERYYFRKEIKESFKEDVTSELVWKNGQEFGYMRMEEEGILGRETSMSKAANQEIINYS